METKKVYILQGLNCANCANKIQIDVSRLAGINHATVNMINTTLNITAGNYPGDITQDIKKIVRTHEPDVVVYEKPQDISHHGHNDAHSSDNMRFKLVSLCVGAALFIAGFFVQANLFLRIIINLVSYIILGWDVVWRALRNIVKGRVFDENFLMTLATVGAFSIGEYSEAAGVMLFYQIGEMFQDAAVRRSKKSITALMDIRPDFANIRVGGEIIKVMPDTLQVGDIIIVKPGEKIPLDGVVIDGASTLDTKALTGESLPHDVEAGDSVISGCISQSGVLTIEVTKTFGESTVSKIIDLVENSASKKAKTENFITTFSRYYTPIVVIIAAMLAVFPPLVLSQSWTEWINRGLVFLVISCPCALVISIPLGFFGGIGGASKKGILIKGANYLEALNKLDTVVFDKTGTLTKGVFNVTNIHAVQGYSESKLLELAAYAESLSNHPIGLSIQKAYGGSVHNKESINDYIEISGQGVSVYVSGKHILAGNDKLMTSNNIAFLTHEPQYSGTKVYIAVDGDYAGCITISDQIKPDSKQAIGNLKAAGIGKIVMLTGDNTQTAQTVAAQLGIDEVYSQLLPHQKVEQLELLDAQKRPGTTLAFVGDGINDAPVLARADIGIAMGGLGSDAAIEAADIVIMTDEPSKISQAIDVARHTKKIVWQNIVFALGIKVVFLILGGMGVASMWEAVFADVGVAVLAILNSIRAGRN